MNFDPHLPTDSGDYHLITSGVMHSAQVTGLTCEIGLRRGGGSKYIIDAISDMQLPKTHIAIDPYGNIDYATHDNQVTKMDYTNIMRNECMVNIYRYCIMKNVNFMFYNMEDTEFFNRYNWGVPVYSEQGKQIINLYSFVHFDGPHCVQAIIDEIFFFHPRTLNGAVFVFDDINNYDHGRIDNLLKQLGWNELEKSGVKQSYVKQI